MAGYLLSTKACHELILGRTASEAQVFWDWLDALKDTDGLFVSEISLGELRSHTERSDDPVQRDDWRRMLEEKVPARFGNRVLTFRGEAVRRWGMIRLLGEPPLPAEETQIVGQCLADDLSLVGPRQPQFSVIRCKLADPYDGASWPGPDFSADA